MNNFLTLPPNGLVVFSRVFALKAKADNPEFQAALATYRSKLVQEGKFPIHLGLAFRQDQTPLALLSVKSEPLFAAPNASGDEPLYLLYEYVGMATLEEIRSSDMCYDLIGAAVRKDNGFILTGEFGAITPFAAVGTNIGLLVDTTKPRPESAWGSGHWIENPEDALFQMFVKRVGNLPATG